MRAEDAIDDDGVNNTIGNNLELEWSASLMSRVVHRCRCKDYRIREGSIAHNTGVSSFAGKRPPLTDMLGNTRVEPFDIGAYEIDEGQQVFILSTNVNGSGSISKSPDKVNYLSGDVVTLQAVPSQGWSFSNWSGDKTGTSNPTTLTITRDMSVTATFEDEPSSPPVIPTSLDADENTPGCADLDWASNTESDLAGYVVYYGPQSVEQGAASVYPDSVEIGPSSSTRICNFSAGEFFFAVRAFNTSGQYSGFSSEASLVFAGSDNTGPVIEPGFPGNGAVGVDPSIPNITVVISDSGTGVNANAISVKINGTAVTAMKFVGNAVSYTIECTPAGGLPANGTATVEVTADDLASPANRSTIEYSFTTGVAAPPNAPSALAVGENTFGCADASWQANAEADLAGYVLYYGPQSVEQGEASVLRRFG